MYVCICNAISDKQIDQAVEDGVRSMKELCNVLPVASTCGRCGTCARKCLNEALDRKLAALPATGHPMIVPGPQPQALCASAA